jgi:hypothetical protein
MRDVSVVSEMFQVKHAGIGCTVLMKKNSENAQHFTIGANDM